MEIILGAITSVLVQIIKKYFDTSSWQSWGIAVLISFVIAILYTFIQGTSFWPTLVQIATTSGAVYSYIISMVPKATSTE